MLCPNLNSNDIVRYMAMCWARKRQRGNAANVNLVHGHVLGEETAARNAANVEVISS